MARAGYWNHNVHYQPVILRAVPPGCGAALEVGCGDGLLASRLAERCAEVTAIDRDARMTALARSRAEAAGPGRVTVVEADYLAYPVADASFDFACANTSLHHMDFAAALAAMARALRPGGRLAVVGLAAHGSFGDYLADAPGIPVGLAYRAVRGKGDPGAPIKDPEMTWAEVRATARRLLPGVRYRRHLLFRYSLLWRKPRSAKPGLPPAIGVATRHCARGAGTYSPTSAGVPLVMRMSSAYEVGKTVCGWPPAAQISSYLSSQVSTRVRIGLGWPTGATPPMA